MRLVKRATFKEFAEKHPLAHASCERLAKMIEQAHWGSTNDVINDIRTAKTINGERVRFEIGNNHRAIVSFNFDRKIAYIKFIGTHAEYDKIEAQNVCNH